MSRASRATANAVVTGLGGPSATTWTRRVLSLGLYASATLAFVLLSPGLLALALGSDLIRPRRRAAALRTLAFFGLYFGCELLGIVAAFGLWLRHRPVAGAGSDAYLEANFRLQCWWAGALGGGAFRLYSLRLEVEGEDQVSPGPLLVFARHASVADTVLPMMLIATPHRIVLRWVMKRELLWDPCIDIVGNRLRNCFVSRLPDERDQDVAAVSSLLDDLDERSGVLIYPEGTRFSAAKRAYVLSKLDARGDRRGHTRASALRHVLPPRRGGSLALLTNNPGADVLFCAHTGLEAAASFWDLWRGELVGRTVRVKLWRVPFAEIPGGPGEAMDWLHGQWERVDAWIAAQPR